MSAPTTVGSIAAQSDLPDTSITTFDASAYFQDLDAETTATWSVSGLPGGTGLSFNTSTGVLSGTPNSSDTAASPFNLTFTLTQADGPDRDLVVTFLVAGTPSAAASFYVDPTLGDDGDAGDAGNPWKTMAKASTVGPDASGDTLINLIGGETTTGEAWVPQNAGTDATHQIGLTVSGGGIFTMKGNSTSDELQNAIVINDGVDWVNVQRASASSYLLIDGEIVFGTGAGEVERGEAPESVDTVSRGIYIAGDNTNIDCDVQRTAGWIGLSISSSANNTTISVNWSQHGTPAYIDGNDFGDTLTVSQSMPATQYVILAGTATGREMKHGGHSLWGIPGGSGTGYGYSLNNDWSSIATFSGDDGNRTMFTHRRAENWHFFDMAFQRSGRATDSDDPCNFKLEGTKNTVICSVIHSSPWGAIRYDSGSWSWHARDGGIAHCVVENLPGPILSSRDYLDDGAAGNTRVSGFEIRNCIFRNIAYGVTNPDDADLGNAIINLTCSDGVNWENVIQMHDCVIEDSSRTLDDFEVRIIRGISPPGTQSLQYMMDNFPANFSNIVVVTDAELDSAPNEATDADVTALATEYLVTTGNSDSLGQAGPLTTVSGSDAGSGTTLTLNTTKWFPNPAHGTPGLGQFSSGFYVDVGGTNVEYTAVNYSSNTLTLASGISRSSGDPVRISTSTGQNANIGLNLTSS